MVLEPVTVADETFLPPNLIIAGAQKAGTTWLHLALGKSRHVFASREKELHYFNRTNRSARRLEYLKNFPLQKRAAYYMESTPNYFQKPTQDIDVPRAISEDLGRPKIIVVLRNPVDRYESAFVHHMMQGRYPYAHEIDVITDRQMLLSFGAYSEILRHWNTLHPDTRYLFYDDLVADPRKFMVQVFDYLGLRNDIWSLRLKFRVNDKQIKKRESCRGWTKMPRLSARARAWLVDYYRPGNEDLGKLLGRDLSHWSH